MKRLLISVLIINLYFGISDAQAILGYQGFNAYEIIINDTLCSCDFEYLCPLSTPAGLNKEFAYSPDSLLFSGTADIFQIDPQPCVVNPVFDYPDLVFYYGLVALGGGLFYTMDNPSFGDQLYLIDINSGLISPIGSTGYPAYSEICTYNGELFYITTDGIVNLNPMIPSNSEFIASPVAGNYFFGLTASPWCNTLLVFKSAAAPALSEIHTINILDGSYDPQPLCLVPTFMHGLISIIEIMNPPPCELILNVSCLGAEDTHEFTCLNTEGVPVTAENIRLFADDWIEFITITLEPPLPDSPDEVLIMNGTSPNIDVSGSGSNMITFTNLGNATLQEFKNALQLIVYNNFSLNPTAGLRTIKFQFTSISGSTSEPTYFYIDVISTVVVPLDLGPDIEACDGSSVTLDAGNPGATFEWSTGDDTQTITVNESGQYIVIVSDGVNCPNQDTVVVDLLPVIYVELTGDSDICDNEQANLVIETDSPFPLTITIDADPGSSFVFSDVSDHFSFIDLPTVPTTYTITEVIPDQLACIEITDPTQIIEVYPTYLQEQEVSLCDGDSIWLGLFWESEAGVYENLLETEYGCDSMVTTYITILPAVQIAQQSTTCDSAAAGIFITHLDNPNGCDTVVTTTVTLLPSDTTLIALSSCVWTQAGIEIDTFSNQNGCDSLVITTTSYIPPADTTFNTLMTCDSSLLGVSYDTLQNALGCDSIVSLMVSFSLSDTTYISGTSCIPSEIGVFDTLLMDAQGCDSLIISTITQGLADTTSLFTNSCDPASLGVFEELLVSSLGCDSLIITTVTFSAQDSTFISASTCDAASAGMFVTSLINQFGCDSIVTETVSLLPSDATSFQSTTCDPSAAGVFMQMLTNQFGCDSIVTQAVTLLPSDNTILSSTTCNASEAGVFITTLVNQHGCDSVITEMISLLPGDTTTITFNTCDPSHVGSIETIYTGTDGCDSLVIETTTLYPLPVLQVQSAIDYNGFDISCAGDADGSAIANVNGVLPYTYLWSTNETDQLITGLSAGNYAVSVTDGNGCSTDGVITLNEPALFMIGFEISEPDCFDQQLGSITVKPSGGVAPYSYSIDGAAFQAMPDFTGLSEGIYQITSLDANDCNATEIISIDVPLMVQVELGDNQVISLGDSAHLQAIINLPFDSLASILWTGIDSIDCPNCLTQIVAPIITTAYTVSVTSVDGCSDRDSLTVSVTTDQKIYVPNIFSPNGDGINDVLSIGIGDGVEEISSFELFDRWGNMVFLAEHVLPTGPTVAWDGKMNGETINPGVFTYKLVAIFKDGQRFVKYGDITLLR